MQAGKRTHKRSAGTALAAGRVLPAPGFVQTGGPPCWFQLWAGPAGGRTFSCALDLTSQPESARLRGAGPGGGGVEGPISLSSEAPFSWRDIKTHAKCFHVVLALGPRPSRRINPRAARTDMSSALRFHVCPQFQCHHTTSRLIANRPPPPPRPASPPLPPSLATSGSHSLSGALGDLLRSNS